MRMAGDRLPPPSTPPKAPVRRKTVKVREHTRTITVKPRAAGQERMVQAPVLTPKQRRSDKRVAKSLERRGHAPTIFETPLTRTPTQKIKAQQERHTARAVLNAYGIAPNRPLKHTEVKAVLHDKGVQDLLKSTTPYLAKEKKHHSFLHNALHSVGETLGVGDITHQIRAQQLGGPKGKVVEGGVVNPTQLAAALVGLSDKAAKAATGAHVTGSIASTPVYKLTPAGKEFKAIGRDALNLPANTISSTYLTATNPGEVAKGTLEQIKHPVKTLKENPISTLMILRGGEAALSRGLGDAARLAPKGTKLHAIGSTERVPLHLTGNATVQRRYSKGLIEKGFQAAADTRAVRKGRGVYAKPQASHTLEPRTAHQQAEVHAHKAHEQHAAEAHLPAYQQRELAVERALAARGQGNGSHGADVVQLPTNGHVRVNGKQPKGKLVGIQATDKQMFGNALKTQLGGPRAGYLNRRIDQEVGTNAAMVRITRQEMLHKMRAVAKKLGRHADALPLVLEGVIKHGDIAKPNGIAHALLAERERLTTHGKSLTSPFDRKLNRSNVKIVDRLLNDPGFLRDPSHVFNAAADFNRFYRELEAKRVHYGDFNAEAAARRTVLPYAQREHGLVFNHDTSRFEVPNQAFTHEHPPGQAPTTEDLLTAFEQAGGKREHLGYVHPFKDINQPVNFRGGAGGMLRRPGASKRYTGSATLAGLYHRNLVGLAEQLAHAATRVERHRNLNEIVNVFSYKQNGEHYFTPDHALRIRRDLETLHPNEDWVAVPVLRKTAPETARGELHPAELQDSFGAPIEDASIVPDQGHHVVLMRREVYDRINAHENVRKQGALGGIQTATQYFRHAVLPTSPKWVVGNTVEAILRTGINDPTLLNSLFSGKYVEKLMKGMGEEGQYRLKRLQAAAAAGHFMSQKSMDFFRPKEAELMQKAHAFRQKPGPKQVGDAWDAYKNVVFFVNEHLAENSIYRAALGKEAKREIQSFTGAWHKTLDYGGEAYKDVARGLLDSNNIARYVKAIDDMRGRYSNLSPSGRQVVTLFTPFGPWYVNALHFVGVTLPAHHPIFTGGLAASYQGSADLRKKANLPPWFTNAIPQKGGKVVDLGYFTPFGAFSGGQAGTENLHNMVLPQISGPLLNLAGKDWTLRDLPKGEHKGLVALNTALETFIPFLAKGRAVAEGGATAQPGSSLFHIKTKEKGHGALAGLNKAFNPFRPQSANPPSANPELDKLMQKYGGAQDLTPDLDKLLKKYGGGG